MIILKSIIYTFFITVNTYFISMIAFMIAYTLDSAVPSKAFWFNTIQNGFLALVIGFLLLTIGIAILYKWF